MFAAVAKADTDIAGLIRRDLAVRRQSRWTATTLIVALHLATVGQTDGTEVTAFTDGCPGLRWLERRDSCRGRFALPWTRLSHQRLLVAALGSKGSEITA